MQQRVIKTSLLYKPRIDPIFIMPKVLPKLSEYLNNFYRSRLPLYEAHRKSFDPENDLYAYHVLEKNDQYMLYSLVLDTIVNFGYTKSVLHLDIPENFLSIEDAANEIDKFKNAIDEDIFQVKKLVTKYNDQSTRLPILELSISYLTEISDVLKNALNSEELKDRLKIGKDVFNVYINNGDKKSITIGLNQHEVLQIRKAIIEHSESIFVANKKLNLKDIERIQIFDNSRMLDQSSIPSIRDEFRKMNGWSGNYGVQLLQQCGLDVSDRFPMTAEVSPSEIISQPKRLNNGGKIFISHASKDQKIVVSFTEKILELGLGIKSKTEIFNTSIEDAGIQSGEDFKARIKKELTDASAVILIITDNYKKSEACLNEMGAAWALELNVIPFILEPINHSSVGFIHSTTQLLKLNSDADLRKFVAEWKGNLFSADYNDAKLNSKIEEFIRSIGQ